MYRDSLYYFWNFLKSVKLFQNSKFKHTKRWHHQNGVGSSKHLALHKNIFKKSVTVKTNFVRTLGNSKKFRATKVMLNQGKGNLETVGHFCGIFTCPWLTPSLGGVAVLKTAACTSSVGPWPWFQREQSRLYSHITVFICSNLAGGYLKDWHKVCLCFIYSELTQGRKVVNMAWNIIRWTTTKNTILQLPGQKITVETNTRRPNAWMEKLGETSLGN